MANISKEVNIEMLEKLPDGTYKKKNPATKAELVKETAQKKFVSDAEKAEIAKVKDKSDKTYVDGELNKRETPAGAQAKATKALTDSKAHTDNKVKTDVPVGAKFTDTVYNHPSTHPASMITESATKRFVSDSEKSNWNSKETPGGAQAKATKALTDANTHTNNKVKTDVPVGAKFTDTVATKEGIGLGNVDNIKQASKSEFDLHSANDNLIKHKASQISLADNKFTANNVEAGMSELFTNVSNGKGLVSGAITGVDNSVVIPTEPSFSDLAGAIGGISTGKKWASGDGIELYIYSTDTNAVLINISGFVPRYIIAYAVSAGPYKRESTAGFMDGKFTGGLYATISNISVVSGGIILELYNHGDQMVNMNYEWIAFE